MHGLQKYRKCLQPTGETKEEPMKICKKKTTDENKSKKNKT